MIGEMANPQSGGKMTKRSVITVEDVSSSSRCERIRCTMCELTQIQAEVKILHGPNRV